MKTVKRFLSLAVAAAVAVSAASAVMANEHIDTVDFNNGYVFPYNYSDPATGQSAANSPWFVNKDGVAVYDTAEYAGSTYPTNAAGSPAYPRAKIDQVISAERNEEAACLYSFDIGFERNFMPMTYRLRYGAVGWTNGKTQDVDIVEVDASGMLKFGSYQQQLELDKTYKLAVLVDVRGDEYKRTLYIDGEEKCTGESTAIGQNPDTNTDAKKVFTESIILRPYIKQGGTHVYLDAAVSIDNCRIDMITAIDDITVMPEEETDVLYIPASGERELRFGASGVFSDISDAQWRVEPETDGISIDESGCLTVTPEAEQGVYSVIAEYNGKSASYDITLEKIIVSIKGENRILLPADGSFARLTYSLTDGNGNTYPAEFSLNKPVEGVIINSDGVLTILNPDRTTLSDLEVCAVSDGVEYSMPLNFEKGFAEDFSENYWSSAEYIKEWDGNKYLSANGSRSNSPTIMTEPGFENLTLEFRYNAVEGADKNFYVGGASKYRDDSTIDPAVWWFRFTASESGDKAYVNAWAENVPLISGASVNAESDWLDVKAVFNGNKKKVSLYVNGQPVFENTALPDSMFDYKIGSIINYATIDDVRVYSGERLNSDTLSVRVSSGSYIPRVQQGESVTISLKGGLYEGDNLIENANIYWSLDEEYSGVTLNGNRLTLTDEAPDSFYITASADKKGTVSTSKLIELFTPEVYASVSGDKLMISADPNTAIEMEIYPPASDADILDAFLGSSDKGDEGVVPITASVITDKNGKAEYDISQLAPGAYKAYVRKAGEQQENYVEFSFRLDDIFDTPSNISDERFCEILKQNTAVSADEAEAAFTLAASIDKKEYLCSLCKSDINNFYIACEIVDVLEDSELSKTKAEKLIENLKSIGLDSSAVELIMKNVDHESVCTAAFAAGAQTPEEFLAVLKEQSILKGLEKLANVYDAKVFLAALGNSKYDKATQTQKNYICEQVGNKPYGSIQNVNNAINALDLPSSSGTGGGGGSSTSSSKSPSGVVSSLPVVAWQNDENAAADNNKNLYYDVDESHWAYPCITQMSRLGIISGSDGFFRPNDSVTRAEFVKLLNVTFGIASSSEPSFSDVSGDEWYAPYISGAKKAELVNGFGDEFMPRNSLSRQDAAVMIYRFMLHNGYQVGEGALDFDDNEEISSYAVEAVAALKSSGIIKGVGANLFAPSDNITRAEAAQMIYNISEGGNV